MGTESRDFFALLHQPWQAQSPHAASRQVTLSRPEPHQYSSPPFSAWQREHPEVKLGTLGDAAAHGEMVVNATAGAVSLEALEQAGEENLINGKILIDI